MKAPQSTNTSSGPTRTRPSAKYWSGSAGDSAEKSAVSRQRTWCTYSRSERSSDHNPAAAITWSLARSTLVGRSMVM